VVSGEAAQRALHDFADVLRTTIDADVGAARIELEAELRGDDDAITRTGAEGLERTREQLLVLVRPVRLGRVEERAPELDGAVDGGDRLVLVALLGRP
jgi:hypothetical protein